MFLEPDDSRGIFRVSRGVSGLSSGALRAVIAEARGASTVRTVDVFPLPRGIELIRDALDLVVDTTREMAALTAKRFRQIDAVRRGWMTRSRCADDRLSDVVMRGLRLEVAAALRVTENVAESLIVTACALVNDYPDVLESLSRGAITEQHARVLLDAVVTVEPDRRERIAARALELAEERPVGAFRRAVKRLIEAEQQESLVVRHERALIERRVTMEAAEDGMAWLSLHIPAVEAQAAHSRLTSMAKVIAGRKGESRTVGQLRADIACDLLVDGNTDSLPAEASGVRAQVVVTVPALSLLGDAEDVDGAATVEGAGPIPLDKARELCGGAEGWMRVLTHPETGMVLSVGRDQYRPPAALRRLVKWRSERCMAPGCGVPASRCDIDHTLAWEDGGHTALENSAPLCRGHHRVKHHGGWNVRQIPGSGGVIEWTSPSGRRYLVEPERRIPAFRPSESVGPAPF